MGFSFEYGVGGEGKRGHKRPLTARCLFQERTEEARLEFDESSRGPGKTRMVLKGKGRSYRLCTGKVWIFGRTRKERKTEKKVVGGFYETLRVPWTSC